MSKKITFITAPIFLLISLLITDCVFAVDLPDITDTEPFQIIKNKVYRKHTEKYGDNTKGVRVMKGLGFDRKAYSSGPSNHERSLTDPDYQRKMYEKQKKGELTIL